MKNIKKLLGVVCVFSLIIGLSSCGKSQAIELKIKNNSTVEIEEVVLTKDGEKNGKALKDSEIDEKESFKITLDDSYEKDGKYKLTLVTDGGEAFELPITLKEENNVKIEGNKASLVVKVNDEKEKTFTIKAKEADKEEPEKNEEAQQTQLEVQQLPNSQPSSQTQPAPAPQQATPAPQADKNMDNCVTDALLND